jgi:hypothetical protein
MASAQCSQQKKVPSFSRPCPTMRMPQFSQLRPQPVHDWTSHAADSFRYLALTLDRKATQTGFHRRIEYSQLGLA